MIQKKKTLSIIASFIFIAFFIVLAGCGEESGGDAPENGSNNENSSENGSESSSSSGKGDSSFPEKPIEVVVPYGAGGSTDQIARLLQEKIGDYLPNNGSIEVVNSPGGAGTIGLTNVLNAESDGYTIGLTASGALTNQPHYGNASYTHDSFQSVARVATSPILMAVNEDQPWDSTEEWLDYLRENPGEFTYSSSGTGNPAHIAMEKLGQELNTETVNVPADGSSEAFVAMLGGSVQGTSGSSQQFAGQDDSEDFQIIANLGSIKGKGYEDVPTLKEEGVDAETDIFFGVLAPKEIPEERLNILTDAFNQVLQDEEIVNQFNAAGVVPDYAGPEEFQEVITNSFQSEGAVLEDMGMLEDN